MLLLERVYPSYDPDRGAALQTLLTHVLRNHFRRLIKVTVRRALVPIEHLDSTTTEDPRRALEIQVSLQRMGVADRALVDALIQSHGNVTHAARLLHQSETTTRRRTRNLSHTLTLPDQNVRIT